MIEHNYITIAANKFVDILTEYDEMETKGYTRSDFSYYVPADQHSNALFVVTLLPPTDRESYDSY